MIPADLEQAILDHVLAPGYQPVKPRGIARKLGVRQDEVVAVRKAIKRLVRRGKLRYGPKHRVQPPGAGGPAGGRERVVGVFQRKEAGYGFVRPSGAARGEGRAAEIYVPASKSLDAATGDLVAVELSKKPSKRRPGLRGRIVEVIERETHQFVGVYGEAAGTAYVQVDGTVFARPVSVGDPSAHRVRPGDKVVIEMVRFPSPYHEGEGVITEVLGPPGRPGVDTLTILREFGLPDRFPEDVLEEARLQAEQFDPANCPDRLDATRQTVITIDPAEAKDFDDAISLTRTDQGGWRLGVHIADVAHFVRPGTALDREARERATSVYLPDRVVPMLPEVISNSLASLQPGKPRFTKSVYIELNEEGQPLATDVHRAVIQSNKRLTYEQVDQFLADPEPWRRKLGAKVHALLGRMHQLAMLLRRRRLRQGALELNMPEVAIQLDRQGRVTGAEVVEYTESHQIIEEFMLAANEAVADLLAQKGWPFLRRIHEPPTLRKLQALTEFVQDLGLVTGSLESRFELQKLLDQVAGQPEQHAVHYAVLRSMQQAVYSPQPVGHYALASPCYCHFTSPIRRYPDLTIHRLLDAHLAGTPPTAGMDELLVLGEHCSQREQRAEAAERELTKLKLLSYFSQRIGETMDAVVTGVESFGLFVQGLELPAEGLIHVTALGDDFYRFDPATHTLTGHRAGNTFRLGDLVQVTVSRVDLDRRELDFRLVRQKPRPGRTGPKQARRKAPAPPSKPPPRKGRKKKR